MTRGERHAAQNKEWDQERRTPPKERPCGHILKNLEQRRAANRQGYSQRRGGRRYSPKPSRGQAGGSSAPAAEAYPSHQGGGGGVDGSRPLESPATRSPGRIEVGRSRRQLGPSSIVKTIESWT